MKHYFTLLLFCITLFARAQRLPFGIRLNTGIDMVLYDAPTRQYFSNAPASTVSSAFNYQQFFLLTAFTNPYSWLKDSLTINEVPHPASEQLSMEFWSWSLGYSVLLPQYRLSIDPYIGLQKSYIQNHNGNVSYGSQWGSSFGFHLYYYTKPVLREKCQWYWFLNNQFSFPQLYKQNAELGKFRYSAGIGFGIRWGSMKDYWQRHYR